MNKLEKATVFHGNHVRPKMNDYKFQSALVHRDVMQQHAYLCLVAIAEYVAILVGPSEEDQA
jgi:hypothetical protein